MSLVQIVAKCLHQTRQLERHHFVNRSSHSKNTSVRKGESTQMILNHSAFIVPQRLVYQCDYWQAKPENNSNLTQVNSWSKSQPQRKASTARNRTLILNDMEPFWGHGAIALMTEMTSVLNRKTVEKAISWRSSIYGRPFVNLGQCTTGGFSADL